MTDVVIDAPSTYVTSSPSTSGPQATIGYPVPGDQPPLTVSAATKTIDATFAERLVLFTVACAITLAAFGVGRSTRLMRWFDGTGALTLAWPSGLAVNGVVGPNSLTFATGRKSVVVTQLSATDFAAEGNIAS